MAREGKGKEGVRGLGLGMRMRMGIGWIGKERRGGNKREGEGGRERGGEGEGRTLLWEGGSSLGDRILISALVLRRRRSRDGMKDLDRRGEVRWRR